MDFGRVLILTGSYGDGHRQAALALEKAFHLKTPQLKTKVLDVTTYVHPLLDTIGKRAFISGVTHFPTLYHFLYKKTRKENVASAMFKKINRLGIYHLIPTLLKSKPDVIISTFPIAAGMISLIKSAGWLRSVPLITVITDHSVHSAWIHPQTDLYLVGSQSVKKGLLEMGVESGKIKITGIPIHPKFSVEQNRSRLRNRHHIGQDQKVLLIMGGGVGIFKHFQPVLRQLDHMDWQLKIVIICGHNQKLYHHFMQMSRSSKHDIQVEAFVNNINEWMAMADVMITKPGGLTISEAIASELPMIIYKPLGGQEADNASFLLSSGIAIAADNRSELIDYLNHLLADKRILDQMRTNMQAISAEQKHSAQDAVGTVEQVLASIPDFIRFA